MKPMKLSPPIVVEPVHGLGEAVTVHGYLAKTETTETEIRVFRYRAADGVREQIGHGQAPSEGLLNIPVARLTIGDQIFAVQRSTVDGQPTTSADPPPKLVTAVALDLPLPAPLVNDPYTCARKIGVGHIVDGATVEVYHRLAEEVGQGLAGHKIFEGPIGFPNLVVGVDPLQTDDEVYAVQRFVDTPSAESPHKSAVPYPGRLPTPRIRPPLVECAPSFEVDGLVTGAQLVVRNEPSGQLITDPYQAVGGPLASVGAGKGLEPSWALVAHQQLCGEPDRSPTSNPPVPVEEISHLSAYRPRIVGNPKPGDLLIVVAGVHEATVRILSNQVDIGGGTCYGTTPFALEAPLPNAPIRLVQSFDCRGTTWEAESPPEWPISRPFEVFPEEEQKSIDLTNAERAAVGGCPPVQPHPTLTTIARLHSQDLAKHPGLWDAPPPPGRVPHPGHYGSDGMLGWDELVGGKIVPGRITVALGATGDHGENAAWGKPTAQAAFDTWFNETPPNDGHRRNILNCKFRHVGVGIAQAPNGTRYYTQDFFV